MTIKMTENEYDMFSKYVASYGVNFDKLVRDNSRSGKFTHVKLNNIHTFSFDESQLKYGMGCAEDKLSLPTRTLVKGIVKMFF